MIPTITSGNSFSGLVEYNEKKVRKGVAERIDSNVIPLNSSSVQIVGFLDDVSAQKPNVEDKTFHVSLALAKDDILSKEQLCGIANDYMEKMGYKDAPYMIYRHSDTKVDHVHIVGTRITIDGKKVSDSYERYHSQRVARKLEIEYGITVVSSKKGQNPIAANDEKEKENESQYVKNKISAGINEVINVKKVTNFEDFVKELKKNNIIVQLVKIDTNGDNLVKPGVVYSYGKYNNPETKRIKGSSFYQGFTYEKILNKLNVNQIIEQTKPKKERSKDELKKVILKILEELKSPNLNDIKAFDKLLEKHDLKAIYFKNSGGIYGFKVQDLTNMTEYKASDLNRDFSWNNVKKLLDGTESNINIITSKQEIKIPFIVNVAPVEGDKKIQWEKSGPNIIAIRKPIKDILNQLAKKGFVSQNELNESLNKIGFKALFLRDFSKDENGIHQIAYTEIATGKTYAGNVLGRGFEWDSISLFVANDNENSTINKYIEDTLKKWKMIDGYNENIDRFIIYLNQNGLTITKRNGDNCITRIGGTRIYKHSDIVKIKGLEDIFKFKQSTISQNTLNALNAFKYVHEPIITSQKELLNSIYLNDKLKITALVNKGVRINLSKINLVNREKSGEKHYIQLCTLQQQIANTLKYCIWLKGNNANPNDKIDLNTMVRALNKRGILITFNIGNSNEITGINYEIKNSKTKFEENDMPKSISFDKIKEFIDIDSDRNLLEELKEKNGDIMNYTERQTLLFRAFENENEFEKNKLISEGAFISFSESEEKFLEIGEENFTDELEENTSYSIIEMKDILATLNDLAQVAQGEMPTNKGEKGIRSTKRKRNKRRR